ncbi:MAG TPA: IMP dehydrogenase, partial [Thermodesulfobacteriota bacterium]|nr:IMP dehydrogenase [Thermodesulfobacteriota bacterium]
MANQPNTIPDGLTFDDLLIQPAYSQIVPTEVEVSTRLTKGIQLNIPIVSAAMDTVTEYQTAISMARQGGIGIIHKNMRIALQATEVEKVKKSESGMIVDPVTMEPDRKVHDVLAVMEKFGISGVPIVRGKKLVGIITNRDLRFETDMNKSVEEVMTKDNLVTARVGINLADSKALLHKNRIEKLLVIDDNGNLKGLITIKDIEKLKKYP